MHVYSDIGAFCLKHVLREKLKLNTDIMSMLICMLIDYNSINLATIGDYF